MPSSRLPQQQQHERQPPQRQQASGNPVRCNLCRKSLSGTVFVLSCQCLFCADCTFSHFEKNSNCPSCNRTMAGENDFRELMISNPPAPDKVKESMYKRIFVKGSPDSKTLTADDLWNRIQRQHAMVREGSKFVLRQFLKENIAQTKRSSQTENALRALKDDHSSLKRDLNKQKEITEGYKQELFVAGQKLEEKDRQLAQFRKMFEARTIPQSTGSVYSGGGGSTSSHGGHHVPARPRRVSDQHFPPPSATGGSSRHSQNHHQHGRQGPRDRANPYEQQLGTSRNTNRTPVVNPYNKASSQPLSQPPSHQNHNRHGQHGSATVMQHTMQNPYHQPPPSHVVAMTQPPPSSQPRRSHSHSHSQHHSQSSYHGGSSVASRRSSGSGSASGNRIRHITANTRYSFSGVGVGSSNSNHSNGGGRAEQNGGGGGGNHRRKRQALSPSHAYAANPYQQGNRGPSSGYHKQSY